MQKGAKLLTNCLKKEIEFLPPDIEFLGQKIEFLDFLANRVFAQTPKKKPVMADEQMDDLIDEKF